MFLCGMGDYLPNVCFCIVTSVGSFCPFGQIFAVASIPPFAPIRLCAEGGFLGQLRILVYLYAPTSGIRQVEMQAVQLIIGHYINELHHFFFRKEMAGNVEMQTSVAETRTIFYRYARHAPGLKQLQQGLSGIEESGLRGCLRLDAVLGNGQPIGFFSCHIWINYIANVFRPVANGGAVCPEIAFAQRQVHGLRNQINYWRRLLLRATSQPQGTAECRPCHYLLS